MDKDQIKKLVKQISSEIKKEEKPKGSKFGKNAALTTW